jgi:hypothetical protein
VKTAAEIRKVAKKACFGGVEAPMEDGLATISRANSTVAYPAEFMLVAAMNPCPCGFLGGLKKEWTCSALQTHRYRPRYPVPFWTGQISTWILPWWYHIKNCPGGIDGASQRRSWKG